jgi:hypothetical protein
MEGCAGRRTARVPGHFLPRRHITGLIATRGTRSRRFGFIYARFFAQLRSARALRYLEADAGAGAAERTEGRRNTTMIAGMPGGYGGQTGPRGDRLSGGRRQWLEHVMVAKPS